MIITSVLKPLVYESAKLSPKITRLVIHDVLWKKQWCEFWIFDWHAAIKECGFYKIVCANLSLNDYWNLCDLQQKSFSSNKVLAVSKKYICDIIHCSQTKKRHHNVLPLIIILAKNLKYRDNGSMMRSVYHKNDEREYLRYRCNELYTIIGLNTL